MAAEMSGGGAAGDRAGVLLAHGGDRAESLAPCRCPALALSLTSQVLGALPCPTDATKRDLDAQTTLALRGVILQELRVISIYKCSLPIPSLHSPPAPVYYYITTVN